MARLFDDAQSEYLAYSGAAYSSMPMVFVGWFRSDDITAAQTILSIADKDTTNDIYALVAGGHLAGDPLYAFTKDGGSNDYAETTSGFSANTWHHACGIFASATDRRVFIDGGSKGTNATNITPANLDRTTISRNAWSSSQGYVSGRVAEAAIWNLTNWPGATAALKADAFEQQALPAIADGFSPLFFPLGLVACWPLGGRTASDSDKDIVGGYHMTAFNTPSTAAHPRVIYPRSPGQVIVPSGAPAFGGVNRIIGGGIYV